MNIFSLLFCEVSLLLKFFSLLLFWSLWPSKPLGYWAFDHSRGLISLIFAFFPVFFPVIGILA